MFYDGTRREIQRFELDSRRGNYGVQIPKGQWYTLEVHESSVIFEVKDGPHTPLTPENMLWLHQIWFLQGRQTI